MILCNNFRRKKAFSKVAVILWYSVLLYTDSVLLLTIIIVTTILILFTVLNSYLSFKTDLLITLKSSVNQVSVLFHLFYSIFFIEIKSREPVRGGAPTGWSKAAEIQQKVSSQATGVNVIFSMSSPGRGVKLPTLMCSYIFFLYRWPASPFGIDTHHLYSFYFSLREARGSFLRCTCHGHQ